MVAIKSAGIEAFLRSPDRRMTMALVYGPDRGLVSERAERLAKQVLGDETEDPFALVKLDGEAVAADPGRLVDEATTISMFGGNRLIWVRDAGTRPIDAALAPLLEKPAEGAFVLFQAGDLKKSSGLRKKLEACGHAAVIPCYGDDARGIDDLIDSQLREFGLSIDPAARQDLNAMLGGDRMASRGEIVKLALYCAGREKITAEDVAEIVGDVAQLNATAVLDAAFSGRIPQLERDYHRLVASGLSGAGLISQAIRHGQTLQRARAALDSGKPMAAALGVFRPPLFFKRKEIVAAQVSLWTANRLDKALADLDDALLTSRRNPGLETALPSRTLMWIARAAVELKR